MSHQPVKMLAWLKADSACRIDTTLWAIIGRDGKEEHADAPNDDKGSLFFFGDLLSPLMCFE